MGSALQIAKAMAGAGATIVFNDIKQELVDKAWAAYEARASRLMAMYAMLLMKRL